MKQNHGMALAFVDHAEVQAVRGHRLRGRLHPATLRGARHFCPVGDLRGGCRAATRGARLALIWFIYADVEIEIDSLAVVELAEDEESVSSARGVLAR